MRLGGKETLTETGEIDFTVERCKMLFAQFENLDYLAEIALLYNRLVETDSQQPVVDMAELLECNLHNIGFSVQMAME